MLCPMQIGMLCSRTLFLSLDETGAVPTGLFQLEGNPCICSVYTNLQNANFAEILVGSSVDDSTGDKNNLLTELLRCLSPEPFGWFAPPKSTRAWEPTLLWNQLRSKPINERKRDFVSYPAEEDSDREVHFYECHPEREGSSFPRAP